MTTAFLMMALLVPQLSTADGPPQASESDVVELGPGDSPPKITYRVEPTYSKAAFEERIQGTVLLEFLIDQLGLPHNVTVISPLGFGLDDTAVRCVSQWRFAPAQKEGKPVKILANIEVKFRVIGKDFDSRKEQRRTKFNLIVAQISREKDKRPNDQEVRELQDLAKQKFAPAEYAIGSWLVDGEFLPKDVDAGIGSIWRAADQRYGPALFFIAKSEINGDLLPKDAVKGLSLIRDAALLGSTEAQFALGSMYERGKGVDVDPDRAKNFYRLCAASGTPMCQLRLGKLLLATPDRKNRDRLQAIAWLELAEATIWLKRERSPNQKLKSLRQSRCNRWRAYVVNLNTNLRAWVGYPDSLRDVMS